MNRQEFTRELERLSKEYRVGLTVQPLINSTYDVLMIAFANKVSSYPLFDIERMTAKELENIVMIKSNKLKGMKK